MSEPVDFLPVINGLFAAIKRGMKTFADWLKELNAVISDHEKIENPSGFPLYEVLFAYYDLRKRERMHIGISTPVTKREQKIYRTFRGRLPFCGNTIFTPSTIWPRC